MAEIKDPENTILMELKDGTVQIDLLLEEALERWSPDAVVLYPAAWNDQAPALRKPDRELLAELNAPSPWDWLRHRSRKLRLRPRAVHAATTA